MLTALVAGGVARLDDRGEVTTDLIVAAPAESSTDGVDVNAEARETQGPARLAAVPDKAAARAQEWEEAAEAIQQAEAAPAAEPDPTTTATAPSSTAAPAQPAAPAAPAPAPARRPTTTNPPAPPPPPEPPSSGGGSLYDKLDNIARCESGMNPKAYNPAGPYAGAFQFHLSTWRSLGESGDPRSKSYAYQRDVAARLQQRSGWGQWPSCAAKYGYI